MARAILSLSTEIIKRFAEAQEKRLALLGLEKAAEEWGTVAKSMTKYADALKTIGKVATVITVVISVVRIVDLLSQGKIAEAAGEAASTLGGLAAGLATGAGGAAMIGGIEIVVAAEIEGFRGAAAMIEWAKDQNVHHAAWSYVGTCKDAASLGARDFVADTKLLGETTDPATKAMIEESSQAQLVRQVLAARSRGPQQPGSRCPGAADGRPAGSRRRPRRRVTPDSPQSRDVGRRLARDGGADPDHLRRRERDDQVRLRPLLAEAGEEDEARASRPPAPTGRPTSNRVLRDVRAACRNAASATVAAQLVAARLRAEWLWRALLGRGGLMAGSPESADSRPALSDRRLNGSVSGGRQVNTKRQAASLLLGVILAACAGTAATPTPDMNATPAPLAPSPPPSSSSSPFPSPSVSPAAPTPAVSPEAAATPAADDALVARIFVYPDVTVGRVPPMLSVYADGRVLAPSWSPEGTLDFVVRRLAPAGLAALRSALEGSGFFVGDIEIPPLQATDSGYTTYAVSLRIAGRLVTARTTNSAMSAQGRALVDLAERWTHPERELPADAWLPGQSVYQGTSWYLVLHLLSDFPVTQAADSAALEAAVGDLASFGRLVQSLDDGSAVRCGSVDAAIVDRIAAGLVAQGVYREAGGRRVPRRPSLGGRQRKRHPRRLRDAAGRPAHVSRGPRGVMKRSPGTRAGLNGASSWRQRWTASTCWGGPGPRHRSERTRSAVALASCRAE